MVGFQREAVTVPGKRISDMQVSKYKELRGKHNQEAAAGKLPIKIREPCDLALTATLRRQL